MNNRLVRRCRRIAALAGVVATAFLGAGQASAVVFPPICTPSSLGVPGISLSFNYCNILASNSTWSDLSTVRNAHGAAVWVETQVRVSTDNGPYTNLPVRHFFIEWHGTTTNTDIIPYNPTNPINPCTRDHLYSWGLRMRLYPGGTFSSWNTVPQWRCP